MQTSRFSICINISVRIIISINIKVSISIFNTSSIINSTLQISHLGRLRGIPGTKQNLRTKTYQSKAKCNARTPEAPELP